MRRAGSANLEAISTERTRSRASETALSETRQWPSLVVDDKLAKDPPRWLGQLR
jgi:hypothetical protein